MQPVLRRMAADLASRVFALVLACIAISAPAAGRQRQEKIDGGFRWIHPGSDPKLWREIRSAFAEELTPDAESSWYDRPAMSVKLLAQPICS